MSVTTLVIKISNETIQILQIDEKHIKNIERAIPQLTNIN